MPKSDWVRVEKASCRPYFKLRIRTLDNFEVVTEVKNGSLNRRTFWPTSRLWRF